MKLKHFVVTTTLFTLLLASAVGVSRAADGEPDLKADLKLLQGSWEMRHGNEGKGPPTLRSEKTITGNRETLRRYSIETGKLLTEHSVEFELHEAGPVRVFTFFPVGSQAKTGYSFVYKVGKDDFYDITGLLHGTEYRDYAADPTIWRWKRLVDKPATESKSDGSADKAK
jgi:hypothetical protein